MPVWMTGNFRHAFTRTADLSRETTIHFVDRVSTSRSIQPYHNKRSTQHELENFFSVDLEGVEPSCCVRCEHRLRDLVAKKVATTLGPTEVGILHHSLFAEVRNRILELGWITRS